MCVVSFRQKINLFQPVILLWILSISAVIILLVMYLASLSSAGLTAFSGVLSNGLILLIFLLIIFGAIYKKIDVFYAFITRAKEGFDVVVKMIYFFVSIMVSVCMQF